jgi:DNA-binding transcriptional ArsR family regulator
MELKRPKVPKLVFEPVEEGWQILDEKQQMEVAKAIANPLRYSIFRELDAGPIRQFELADRLSESRGKKYPQTLIRHHLKYLQRAGLIGFERGSGVQGRAKIVYKAADVRIHLHPRPKPSLPITMRRPRTKKELEEGLRKILRGR